MGYQVRAMRPADAGAVLAIYQAGLDTGRASFETTAPTWAVFDAAKLPEHRLVAVDTRGSAPGDSVRGDRPLGDGPVGGGALGDGPVGGGALGDGPAGGSAPGAVLGWVAVSAVSSRCVYRGVVEHSVYVAPQAQGRGVGLALMRALIDSTEAAGVWTIESGVFPENVASLRLHERAGFRVVGVRERLGRQHGVWRDVVLLERRSPKV